MVAINTAVQFPDDIDCELAQYAVAHASTFVNDPVKFAIDAYRDLCDPKVDELDHAIVNRAKEFAQLEVGFCRSELQEIANGENINGVISPTVIKAFRFGSGGYNSHTLSQFAQDPDVQKAIDRAIIKDLISEDLSKADDELLEQLHDLNQQLLNEDDNQQ